MDQLSRAPTRSKLIAGISGTRPCFKRLREVGVSSANIPGGWLVSVSRRNIADEGRCLLAYATLAANEGSARATVLAALKPREGDKLHQILPLERALAAALQLRLMRVRQLPYADFPKLAARFDARQMSQCASDLEHALVKTSDGAGREKLSA
jgi:hypothetical protein